jgi:hypothetical protein
MGCHCSKNFATVLLGVMLMIPGAFAENKEKTQTRLGIRDVSKGVNFYSVGLMSQKPEGVPN